MDLFTTQLDCDGKNFILRDERFGKAGQKITHFENEMMSCDIIPKA
ncbi:MAG: hypothetical protein GXP45_05105 [bacterium]|nr:hypothetical protein [bacterium]